MDAERERPGSPARIALSDDVALIRALFREYAGSLGVDLSFQRFDEELAALPAGYDAVLVAHVDGEPAGCVGVRSQRCNCVFEFIQEGLRVVACGRDTLTSVAGCYWCGSFIGNRFNSRCIAS